MGSRTSFHSLPTRILCSPQMTSNHDPSTPAQSYLTLTALSLPLLPASRNSFCTSKPKSNRTCSGKPPFFHPMHGGMLLLSELVQGCCATRVAQQTTSYSLVFTISRCQPCHPGPYYPVGRAESPAFLQQHTNSTCFRHCVPCYTGGFVYNSMTSQMKLKKTVLTVLRNHETG